MLPPRLVFSDPPTDRAPSNSVGPLFQPRDEMFDRDAAHDTSQTFSRRPSTAPVTQLDDPLIDLIPPRRELPFRRTSGAQKSSDAGSSNGPSSAALPPLPTPNFVDSAAAPPKRNPSASRIAKPQPKPPVIVDDSARDTSATLRASSPLPTSSNKQARQTSRDDPPDPPQTAGSKRPLSALASSESTARHYRSAASHPPPTPSSLRPSTVPSSPPRTLPSSDYATAPSSMSAARTSDPATVPPAARDCVHRVAALIAAADPAAEQENSEAYAAMPANERMAVLDDWVVELIGDEGFLALCRDVEGCWRRIGFEV
ncbi:hypothetical protein W97_07907 [Coniosporium apollinis CBS 100218]|uniref:Uncharacterized protein n=1 Tax=Coniosporium apollinis (strain CBS 100218) TaxID=1168221 RepID=R7Z3R4_CONA1|nr:uncharacterized protein W97_07907 [Coniosporium apollinis CBS 100218]EON68649.1 hypothetical protein W97_07907 [Coniosporium apollinis CBS 100218]